MTKSEKKQLEVTISIIHVTARAAHFFLCESLKRAANATTESAQ